MITKSILDFIISKYKNNIYFEYIQEDINYLSNLAADELINADDNNNDKIYQDFENRIVELLNKIKTRFAKINFLLTKADKIPNLKNKVSCIGKINKLKANINCWNYDEQYEQLLKEIEQANILSQANIVKDSLVIKYEQYLEIEVDSEKLTKAQQTFYKILGICSYNPEAALKLSQITFSDYEKDNQIISNVLKKIKGEELPSEKLDESVEKPSVATNTVVKDVNALYVRVDKFVSSNNIVKVIESDNQNVKIAYRCNNAIVEDIIPLETFKKRYMPFKNYFDSAKFVGKMTSDNRLILYAGEPLGLQYIKETNKFITLPKAYITKCVGEEVLKDDRELYYQMIADYFLNSINELQTNYSYSDKKR